jgi:hypothetical protein
MERLKKKILFAIAMIFLTSLTIESASANECWRIERQLNEANRMLNRGGNQSYMKMWQQARDHNAEELPKCRKRFGVGDPSISVANGSGSNNYGYGNEPPVQIKTDNPQLQQTIKTCNYWIQQHNEYASDNNRVMRNTACENVNRMRREINSNGGVQQEEFRATRSLKECVKPNNKIDGDVKLCMQGLKEPEWLTRNEISQQ